MDIVKRIGVAAGAATRWLDSWQIQPDPADPHGTRTDPLRWIPYITLHVACLGVIWVGWSWFAVATAVVLYVLRMFAITAFYHRYFSHRAFRTSRTMQFLLALFGNTAAQRGPLWWAAQHRRHHAHSDREHDAHSPLQHGLFWSHIGWLTARSNLYTDLRLVPDLARFPELRFLDRFDMLVPIALATALYCLGEALRFAAPGLGTSGPQLLIWGFFVSTVVLFHGTCLINSMAHLLGSRRYDTGDGSRNSLVLALITLGEGWHNNHHHYPSAARQGFFWWEVDISFYLLKLMERCGLIWELRPVPLTKRDAHRLPAARAA